MVVCLWPYRPELLKRLDEGRLALPNVACDPFHTPPHSGINVDMLHQKGPQAPRKNIEEDDLHGPRCLERLQHAQPGGAEVGMELLELGDDLVQQRVRNLKKGAAG